MGEVSKKQFYGGYGLSGLAGAFLLLDAAMKLLDLPVVAQTNAALGWSADKGIPLGVILLAATILYLWPRTAVLGAILLTGYLGGAVAAHGRIGNPWLSHVFFGVYVGIFVWGGLWLRDPRVRALLPLSAQKSPAA